MADANAPARQMGFSTRSLHAVYGGFAALAPSGRPFFQHIGEADSVTLAPHKWLYLPVG